MDLKKLGATTLTLIELKNWNTCTLKPAKKFISEDYTKEILEQRKILSTHMKQGRENVQSHNEIQFFADNLEYTKKEQRITKNAQQTTKARTMIFS